MSTNKVKKVYTQRFREKWLYDDRFENWLLKVQGDLNKAFCRLCNCVIGAKMSDILCHKNSGKHSKAEEIFNVNLKKQKLENVDEYIHETYDHHSLIEEVGVQNVAKLSDNRSRSQYYTPSKDWMVNYDWLTSPPFGQKNRLWCKYCKNEIQAKKDTVFKHSQTRKHMLNEEMPNNIKSEIIVSNNQDKIKISIPPEYYPNEEGIEIVASDADIVTESIKAIADTPINIKHTGNTIQPGSANRRLSFLPPVDFAPDADKNFLLSLHDDMKSLPNRNKLKFKRKVLHLMENLLYEDDAIDMEVEPETHKLSTLPLQN